MTQNTQGMTNMGTLFGFDFYINTTDAKVVEYATKYLNNEPKEGLQLIDHEVISKIVEAELTRQKEEYARQIEGLRKKGNNGEGLPFENSPEIYGNKRVEAYKKGHTEALDDILKIIK